MRNGVMSRGGDSDHMGFGRRARSCVMRKCLPVQWLAQGCPEARLVVMTRAAIQPMGVRMESGCRQVRESWLLIVVWM